MVTNVPVKRGITFNWSDTRGHSVRNSGVAAIVELSSRSTSNLADVNSSATNGLTPVKAFRTGMVG
jgi:hypothetical protein